MTPRFALCAGAMALALAGCTQSDGAPAVDASSTGGVTGGGSGGGGASTGGLAAGGGVATGGMVASGGTNAAGGGPASGGVDSGLTEPVDCRDGGTVASWPPPNDRADLFDGPARLSQTGLYSDIAAGVIASDAQSYTPLASLWADGAAKRRWLKLPPGGVIDTSDMDDWKFPVGTKAFKEFTRDGKRIETRMVWKRGEGDFQMVSYVWNEEQTEAAAAPGGQRDAMCTLHDVPDATMCRSCHSGRTDRFLSPTALQLSHPKDPAQYPGFDISDLIAQSKLSKPPAVPLTLPGDAKTKAALAYLHANCGNCHNPKGVQGADRLIGVYFWQEAAALSTLETTVTYRSLVDKGSPLWIDAVLDRMHRRKNLYQMPPIATKVRDADGIEKVRALMDVLRTKVPPLPPPATAGSCGSPTEIWQMLNTTLGKGNNCGDGFCHSTSAGSFYLYNETDLITNTVAVPASGEGCGTSGLNRIEPGKPMQSLLYLKLLPSPPCGRAMPPSKPLTAEQLKKVYDWIASCKPADGGAP